MNYSKILECQSHLTNSMNHHKQGACSKRPARLREAASAEPGPARPQEARRPRRTGEYVEAYERRERRWRTFSTGPNGIPSCSHLYEYVRVSPDLEGHLQSVLETSCFIPSRTKHPYRFTILASATIKEVTMNPLDSIPGTITAGFLLTVILYIVVKALV